MTYTIWSHGRLVGETELEFVRCMPTVRSGHFLPTELGERLMPIACGVSPAMRRLSQAPGFACSARDQADGIPRSMESTAEYADLLAALAHREGLDLELHGPTGQLVPVEDIHIIDTEYLLALAAEREQRMLDEPPAEIDDPELKQLIEEMEAELEELFAEEDDEASWKPVSEEDVSLPRYQIQIQLFGEFDIL